LPFNDLKRAQSQALWHQIALKSGLCSL